MYQEYYGLRELPFELTSNPKYLYLPPAHQEALSSLQYGLSTAKAVTLLIGEAGTGKTTLLKAALESDRCRHVRAVYLNNPALTRNEFIELVAKSFGLTVEATRSKAAFLTQLEAVLHDRRSQGEVTALVVDEAQSMSTELLEEVRLLANIETPVQKLLPLLLVGQPELGARLEDSSLRQLKQRVALRCEITPLDLSQTAAYIASRIKTAGGVAFRLFTRDAVMVIHEYSRGIPRTISVMCDNALITGVALGRQPVDREMVLEVCRDFRLKSGNGHRLDAEAQAMLGSSGPTEDAQVGLDDAGTNRDVEEQAAAAPRFKLFGGRWRR